MRKCSIATATTARMTQTTSDAVRSAPQHCVRRFFVMFSNFRKITKNLRNFQKSRKYEKSTNHVTYDGRTMSVHTTSTTNY